MSALDAFASHLGLETGVPLGSDGRPTFDDPEEQLAGSYTGIDLVLGDATDALGSGTLHVTTRRIIWVAAAASGSSLGLSYPQVIMHAICKDPTAFAKPCVYLQLEEGSEPGGGDEDKDEGEEGEEALVAEVRLVPSDEAQVEDLFKSLCECSALNPDPDVEEEGQAELFFDDAEVLAGLPDEQRAALLAARAQGLAVGGDEDDDDDDMDELVGDDPDRFEDEDEDEDEEVPRVNGH